MLTAASEITIASKVGMMIRLRLAFNASQISRRSRSPDGGSARGDWSAGAGTGGTTSVFTVRRNEARPLTARHNAKRIAYSHPNATDAFLNWWRLHSIKV